MPNVGYATLSVIPSFQGVEGALTKGMAHAGTSAGNTAGEAASRSTRSKLRAGVGKIATVGALMGGALAVAMVKAIDISEAQAKLSAQLGLSAKDSQRYGKIAGELYRGAYGDSLSQVNEALAAVTRNVGKSATQSKGSLKSISSTVLDLSKTFDVDLGETTRAVGQMLRTGLAPNAKVALDIITRGLQSGANKADDLFDTINEYGTQFRKLGVNGKTAMGLITQGLKAGARDSDLVADAIKEFSIRAVDGSDATAKGFKAVGLNASQMASKIAKGGPTASKALDLTLDKLRAMPDPVKRSQAAVALFGTQAEDLGKALFALDPSAAVGALGKVSGASKRVGDTMHNTAAANLTEFKRTLQSSVVGFIGGTVLPALTDLGNFLKTVLGPAFSAIGSFLAPYKSQLATVAVGLAGLAVAIKGVQFAAGGLKSVGNALAAPAKGTARFARGLRNVNAAYAENATFATKFGAKTRLAGQWLRGAGKSALLAVRQFGALALAYGRAGLAAVVNAAKMVVLRTVQFSIAAATKAWSIAQRLLNVAMRMNPIGIVITALTALVAAIVWAWNNSKTFRTVVMAVWNGIKVAVMAVVNWFRGPFVNAFKTVGAWFKGIFTGIWNFIKAWGPLILAAFLPFIGIPLLIFQNFGKIKAFFIGLWTTVKNWFVSIWNSIVAWFKGMITAYVAYWVATWNRVKAIFTTVWNAVKGFFVGIWNTIVAWFKGAIARYVAFWQSTWNNIKSFFTNVWVGIKARAVALWNSIVGFFTGAFNKFTGFFKGVWDNIAGFFSDVWRGMVKSAKSLWEKIKGVIAKPINFVINTILNGGLFKAWNWIADKLGLDGLKLHVDPIPGYAKGTDRIGGGFKTNGPQAIVGEGNSAHPEYVIPTDPKYRGRAMGLFQSLGSQLMESGGTVPQLGAGDVLGGAWDWASGAASSAWEGIKNVAGGVADFFSDPLGFAKKMLNKSISGFAPEGGSSWWQQILFQLPKKAVTGMIDQVKDWFSSSSGGPGQVAPMSGSARAAQQFARAQLGRFGWGAGQMGPLIRLWNKESGWNANAVNPSSGAYGIPQALGKGRPYALGDYANQVLWGMNYIKRRYGSPAAALQFHLGHNWYEKGGVLSGGYDNGGGLMPGWNLAYNGTGKPENVRTSAQEDALASKLDQIAGLLAPAQGEASFSLYDSDNVLLGTMRGVVEDNEAESARRLRAGRR